MAAPLQITVPLSEVSDASVTIIEPMSPLGPITLNFTNRDGDTLRVVASHTQIDKLISALELIRR